MRLFALLIVISVFVIGCNSNSKLLPPKGSVIYCPHCDTDLYLRNRGTSRTRFRNTDYMPLVFDDEIPSAMWFRVNNPVICPICGEEIVDRDSEGVISKVYYRRYSWK